MGPAAVRRFVVHRLAALGPEAASLAQAVAVLGDDSEVPWPRRWRAWRRTPPGGAADALVRAGMFDPAERLGYVQPVVRATLYEDLAPGERQARHARAAGVLAAEGAPAERVTAHLLRTTPNGDHQRIGTLRSAAASATRRGAPSAAAARLQRALAESPAEHERAEILTELGRCELATLEFASAENHLPACLYVGWHADYPGRSGVVLGRCAIVSGGRSAQAAADALTSLGEELRPADPDRSLELGSELLLVTTAVPQLRAGLPVHLERFGELAGGHPVSRRSPRVVRAQERLFRGAPAAAAVAEVQAVAEERPAAPDADGRPVAGPDDVALRRAVRPGHAAAGHRAGTGPPRGARDAAGSDPWTAGHDRPGPGVASRRPGRGGDWTAAGRGTALRGVQLLAVSITVHIQRGELDAADALARRVEPATIAEDGTYVPGFLVARGWLRIAQASPKRAWPTCCGAGGGMEESRGLPWPSDWRAAGCAGAGRAGPAQARPAGWPRSSSHWPGGSACPARWACRCAPPRLVTGGAEGQDLLLEAVEVLERSRRAARAGARAG